MTRSYQYNFEATIEIIKYGRMLYGGVFLPEAILCTLPEARERGFRLVGEVGGVVSEFGLMAVKTARYIVLSKAFLAQAKLKSGDVVTFYFSPIDPNVIEVPIELEQALRANHAADLAWEKLSVGKRREYAFRVASAAQEETRLRRSLQLMDELIDSQTEPTE